MTCLLVVFLTGALAIPSIAGGEVSLSGKLTQNGKRIDGDNGEQYTIIPDEKIEGTLSENGGQRVKLTGVVYTSHGRNMITAYACVILK
jgi:hypothetical protein